MTSRRRCWPACALAFTGATLALAADDITFDRLRASLPRVEGEIVVPSLDTPVTITRDARGLVTVEAKTLAAAVCGQGYVHAQDRLFQMDIARRLSAGRVSALVGGDGLGLDRRFRPLGLAAVADNVVASLPARHRTLLDAYAEGVNAAIADFNAPPPEYLVIGTTPEPWRPADTILVQLSMFEVLHFNARIEPSLAVLRETLPAPLATFLTPLRTRFDATLMADDTPWRPGSVPGPDVIDLRGQSQLAPGDDLVDTSLPALGSNNWAVAGRRTTHGGAILASDPHLPFSVPGVWHRIELAWDDGWAGGVALPGSPGVTIGSNRHLAWGLTNTMADFQDLVIVEVDPDDANRYRTAEGHEPFTVEEIVIPVRGDAGHRMTVRRTRWGPIVRTDGKGRPLALRWTALSPSMVNVDLFDIHEAATLEAALDVGRGWYGPSQNLVVATATGRIGWIVTGYLPERAGFDGSVPTSWTIPGAGWRGPIPESDRPTLVDPPGGIVYTANQRTVPVARARRLGNAWDLGARAARIRDRLEVIGDVDEHTMLALQLDTRVEVLDFYQTLLLGALAGRPASPARDRARDLVRGWNGHADADQPGLWLVDRYRSMLHEAMFAPLVAPCRTVAPGFRYAWQGAEEPARRLLETRPAHLLPPGAVSWDDLLADVADALLGRLAAGDDTGAALARDWGDVNVGIFDHPFADAAPAFAAMLNLPPTPLAGHALAVRVATPRFGASMRLVVVPGREASALLHMPAGQSGHPLSPHYRDAHADWRDGRATPLLMGPGTSTIRLLPRRIKFDANDATTPPGPR